MFWSAEVCAQLGLMEDVEGRGVWGPEGQGLEGSGVGRRQLRDGDLERHCDIMKSVHLSAWCCLLCRRNLIESPTYQVDNVPPFPSQ